MKAEKQINCICGNILNTSENPQICICSRCNRRYGQQTPKLKLLDIEETGCLPSVIIS